MRRGGGGGERSMGVGGGGGVRIRMEQGERSGQERLGQREGGEIVK